MPWSNQPGGPWGSGSRGPWGSGPQSQGPKPPDLEEFLRRSQDKLRSLLPGNLGGRGIALIALALVALWGFSGFFKVEPDELGVVLRFGKFVREVQPGLNYHLPYPIETALTPPALRVNKIDIGFDMRGGAHHARRAGRKPDADRRREHRRRRFLGVVEGQAERRRRLSVQRAESRSHREGGGRKRHARGDRALEHPADPHRRAAEHRDRGAGADAEDARRLRRRHPGAAGPVAESRSARPRSSTLSATCRRRAPISSARRTRRRPTPIAWCRRRSGRAAKIIQDAEAYREQTVADAKGQTSRFLQIYDQYKKAPDVTRAAHVSGDHGAHSRRHRQDDHRYRPAKPARASCPICRSAICRRHRSRQPPAPDAPSGGKPMKLEPCRRRRRRCAADRRHRRLQHLFHRLSDQAGAGGAARPAGARHHRART